ncbi:MAG: periplasmic heavy metal sensor [Polyangiales bacterium]
MFGFIIGTLCLVGLFATLRARRHGGYGYAGYGCGRAGYGGFGHDDEEPWEPRHHRRRSGRRGALRALFARLDTTPGQEKAIVGLLDQARGIARDKRGELRDARRELSAVFASARFDRDALEASLAEPRRLLDALQRDFVTLAEGLHELLDDRQRRIVGELIADGSFGRGSLYGRQYD